MLKFNFIVEYLKKWLYIYTIKQIITLKTNIMKFIEDTTHQDIMTALLTGQKKIKVDGIEIILRPLHRDTTKRKEIQAKRWATELIETINSKQ